MNKKEFGISLIQVIIAVILIIIITSFALWYASNTSSEVKLARVYSEISSVREAYKNAIVLNELNSETYPLDELFETTSITYLNSNYSNEEVKFLQLNSVSSTDTLYLVKPDNAKKLELEKIELEYVIDDTTGNIYLIGGFLRDSDSNPVYEFKEIEYLYRSALDE